MALLIQNPDNLSLPPEAETILTHMFDGYRRVVIKRELKGGFSPSRVYLVSPVKEAAEPDLPAVVKMAPLPLIDQEWQAYKTCIQDKLPDVARIEGPAVLPPHCEWGGLRYGLVGGGTFAVESLFNYYQTAGVDDLRFVLAQRLFKSMERQRQFSVPTPDFPLQPGYDALLPVNLIIKPAPLPEGVEPRLIKPGALPTRLPALNDYAQLDGFIVTEVDAANHTVTLNLNPPHAYRLRLHPVADAAAYRAGQSVPLLHGLVTDTRHTLLQHQAEQALGKNVDLSAQTLTLAGVISLTNPLAVLPDVLSAVCHVRVACIHGDLNLENILIDPAIR
ncbi:MAG: hypothetical protein ACE5G8_06485, partial [Anaerolineae bacterium]